MGSALSLITVDRASPVPLYFQVAQHLERAIESGELPPGAQLENEVLLAGQLGLSRPTMRRAMQYLVERGLLVRKRGIGTQVVRAKVKRPVELSSLWDDLARSGQQPATTVLAKRRAGQRRGGPCPRRGRRHPGDRAGAVAVRPR